MNTDRFKGRTVLLTGHTGFKGSWLAAWMHLLGAKVVGIALDPPTAPSHFEGSGLSELIDDRRLDIRNAAALQHIVNDVQPDVVFHLAAQPLVRRAYVDPIETYQTNVLGTLHLLEALRKLNKPCTTVLITSDKCYDNVEWVWGYRETDRLGGSDPYSASKAAAELVIRSHVRSFFPKDGNIRIGIGRAGNVIGGGDWAADRIVPDCIRAWMDNNSVPLRNPHATRPWQHVLEPLTGYLQLAESLIETPMLHGEPFNFGPPTDQNHNVGELVETLASHWPGARWDDLSADKNRPYESGQLKLNCDKALYQLGWRPKLNYEQSVKLTAQWYRSYLAKPHGGHNVTLQQIREYQELD